MIIFYILISHSMKISMFQSLKVPSFLFIFICYWLESPVSLFFTEPRLKPNRYGTIIWYQSLGGSFQFWIGQIYTGQPAGDRKLVVDLYF
ncbi:hypothetical protein HanRHA438_Chr17g0806181 [Helianthus annuus]|nr:hypothetical protein HanRHA438_Chr17g0806181 [Helianthus annuus]